MNEQIEMTEAERQAVLDRYAEAMVDGLGHRWAKVPATREILIEHAKEAVVKAIQAKTARQEIKAERRKSTRGSVGDLLRNEAGKWGEPDTKQTEGR